MGETAPRTARDRTYRMAVEQWLRELMVTRELNKGQLAEAMGVDRTLAGRYLSGKVRTPLVRLQAIQRSLRVEVPTEVVDAYWLSEERRPAAPAAKPEASPWDDLSEEERAEAVRLFRKAKTA